MATIRNRKDRRAIKAVMRKNNIKKPEISDEQKKELKKLVDRSLVTCELSLKPITQLETLIKSLKRTMEMANNINVMCNQKEDFTKDIKEITELENKVEKIKSQITLKAKQIKKHFKNFDIDRVTSAVVSLNSYIRHVANDEFRRSSMIELMKISKSLENQRHSLDNAQGA